MAGDQGGLWCSLINGGDILFAHDDGTEPRHLGIAAVEDDHLGLVQLQGLFHLSIPDCITGQIETRLIWVGEDHAAHFTHALAQYRHQLIAAVLATGLLQVYTGKFGLLAQQADILKATGTNGIGIFLMLYKERQMLGDQRSGGIIPVVRMIVGDNNGIHIDKLIDRQRQLDQWIAQLAVGGALKAGEGTLGREHGVDQKAGAGIVEQQGGVANLGNLHGMVPYWLVYMQPIMGGGARCHQWPTGRLSSLSGQLDGAPHK
ncbi:hypothetical protein D3C71_971420 [compost metagenome]